MSARTDWPALPWGEWADTGEALHLWCQILGKYRLAHTPWAVHFWHATLYVVPRGLTTGSVPDAGGDVTLTLDLCDSRLVVEAEGGARESFPLEPMSVVDFLARTRRAVEAVGGTFNIHGRPNELPDPVFGDAASVDAIEMLIVPRAVDLGEMTVRRALPSKKRQMVGPFILLRSDGTGGIPDRPGY